MSQALSHTLPSRLRDDVVEAGCDEAGRGPLAGPVFAAAVVLQPHEIIPGLDDSKKLSEARRQTLRDIIEQRAVAWAVASATAAEIDRINILQASILAMHRALAMLNAQCLGNAQCAMRNGQCAMRNGPSGSHLAELPGGEEIDILRDDISIVAARRGNAVVAHVAVDGNRFKPWGDLPYTTVVHGDALVGDIAAASILAKTYRDEYMLRAHAVYDVYGWDHNKGYPSASHREAIRRYGPSPLHRLSFRLLPDPTLF